MLYKKHVTSILIKIDKYCLNITFLIVHDLVSSISINFAWQKTHFFCEKWYTATKSRLTPKRGTDENWCGTGVIFTSCWAQIFFQNRFISTRVDAVNKTTSDTSLAWPGQPQWLGPMAIFSPGLSTYFFGGYDISKEEFIQRKESGGHPSKNG